MDNIGNNNRESKIRNKKSVLRRTVDNYLDIMDKLYFTNKKRTDNFKINSQSNSNNALIISLFDTHYGEEIKKDGVIKYNFDIADKRIRKYIKDVIKYYLDNKDSIDEIYLVLGGDNIDGDGTVYPHHIQEIEEGFNKQIDRYIKIMTEVIEHLSTILKNKKLHIIAVAGNHGSNKRNTISHPIKDNYDTGIYLFLSTYIDKAKLQYKDLLNVFINFSYDEEYYNFNVKGWNFQARHKLPKNFSTPSAKVLVHGWRELHNIDCILTGHYHDGAIANIGKTKVVRTGSLVGTNDYSEHLGLFGDSEQTLLLVDKDNLIKCYMPINLTNI